MLCQKAQEHAGTVMPGYTHLQRAQPITFGHHLMAYAEMFQRDLGRIADAKTRMDVCPLGSGALAGTTYRSTGPSLLLCLDFLPFRKIHWTAYPIGITALSSLRRWPFS